jgi:gamma-glutamyltranspeptidase/glutathione hydrolase
MFHVPPTQWRQIYPSRRSPLFARNVVSTSQPLAAQAGLRALQAGGNAVDAAIASAITLTVVEPTMNGIGSDAFAIVWDGKTLHGLNASGRSPAAWNRERFADHASMPLAGWDSVTVPGAVSAWAALSQRFGKLPFASLFNAAIGYARDGFVVSPIVARQWAGQAALFADQPGFAEAFLPGGRPPAAGERFVFRAQAETLEAIAESRGEAFYRGALAEQIAAFSRAHGGVMTAADLADHQPDWVEPLGLDYRGVRLHEIPPNGQGIAAQMALGILREWNLGDIAVDSADSLHLQIEAMKLAFGDVYRYVADPSAMSVSATALLDPGYLAQRARRIDFNRAGDFGPGQPPHHGTIYLTAADAAGMMVSLIQSNFRGFGSGVVVSGTGISLQNRGSAFSLDPKHANCVGPRKRPFHTIIPAFLTEGGQALASYGVMGANMQAQGHMQVLIRMRDYGQNPQTALDAPRWKFENGHVLLESGVGERVADELIRRGHRVVFRGEQEFGAGQIIYRLTDGYVAGSDFRRDGQAVGY